MNQFSAVFVKQLTYIFSFCTTIILNFNISRDLDNFFVIILASTNQNFSIVLTANAIFFLLIFKQSSMTNIKINLLQQYLYSMILFDQYANKRL